MASEADGPPKAGWVTVYWSQIPGGRHSRKLAEWFEPTVVDSPIVSDGRRLVKVQVVCSPGARSMVARRVSRSMDSPDVQVIVVRRSLPEVVCVTV